MVVVNKGDFPVLNPCSYRPTNAFVWDNEVKDYAVDLDLLKEDPSGKWWDFLQNLAKEEHHGKWVANSGQDCFQKVVNGVTEDWYRIVSSVQPSNPLQGFVDTPKEEGSSGELRDFFADD